MQESRFRSFIFYSWENQGDLVFATMVGVVAGLSLILLQRFVIDLLGGKTFNTSIYIRDIRIFSLILQDEYWVQMKGTLLGLMIALVFS